MWTVWQSYQPHYHSKTSLSNGYFFSVESMKHVPAIRQVWNNNIIFLLILGAIDNSNKFLIVKYTVKGPYS